MLYYRIVVIALLFITQGKGDGCKEIFPPGWGVVNCSNGHLTGSVCELKCETHYDLVGTTDMSIRTTCMDDGQWSESPFFTCEPIRCFPERQTPMNGDLVCSATNLARSMCVYYCDDGYDLQGVDNDKNAYTECVDDGDGDAIGQWSDVEGSPGPPQLVPVCEPIRCEKEFTDADIPNGKVVCSASNFGASFCVFVCAEGYELKGTSEPVLFTSCKDDGDFDAVGQWTRTEAPVCRKKCKRVKNLQLTALIYDAEDDRTNYAIANRLIVRTVTVLRNKYRFLAAVRVNRYSDEVDTSNEFFTSQFTLKRDKDLMTSIPYPGSGESLEKALSHIKSTLNDESSVRVAMIIANGFTVDAKAQKLAEELLDEGVLIYVFGIPRNGEGSSSTADMAKITGSSDRVYDIKVMRSVEGVRKLVTTDIASVATEMGCKEEAE